MERDFGNEYRAIIVDPPLHDERIRVGAEPEQVAKEPVGPRNCEALLKRNCSFFRRHLTIFL
jgi:hypothetical protein